MAYTTIKKPSDYFNTITYSGNGSNPRTLTGVGFQPDWTWLKNRTDGNGHTLADAVRGANKTLSSDGTASEVTDKSDGHLDAFTSDGFTVGAGSSSDARVNDGSHTYVGWNWLGANGTSANTDGTISSTVSANTTAGFSIVSYTGTGVNATVGHGLGSTADVLIVKSRDGTHNWQVLHKSLATNSGTKNLELNSTSAVLTDATTWNNTAPTSSVFSVGATNPTNQSGQDLIAYCFAEKQGYSKFGSYTGNGNADGTFVYTGFKPAFIMAKKSNSTGNWVIVDTKRDGYNGANDTLQANVTDVESGGNRFDIVSNGFKARSTSSYSNSSGDTFIYMAFAEEPLVGDNPATAR